MKVREKSRECYIHKPQPFPDTKWKRKQTKPKKRKSNKSTTEQFVPYRVDLFWKELGVQQNKPEVAESGRIGEHHENMPI